MDLVPLMRERKESLVPSTTGPHRTIDLLFRARSTEGYVWVELRGWLHVEPGKGRKAIILSRCVRPMPIMGWGEVVRGVGPCQGSFWGVESGGRFLVVGAGIRDVLG